MEVSGIKNLIHQLNWVKSTPTAYSDGQTAHTVGPYYSLQYVDDNSGILVTTPAVFTTATWHHAALTIEPTGAVVVYIDGVKQAALNEDTRN